MSEATKGPYKMAVFKCANGDSSPGVMSEATGGAVCWASGSTDSECLANATLIAKALNAISRQASPEGE